MEPNEQLKIISNTLYKDYEGAEFQIKLKNGLTGKEIDEIKRRIPKRNLNKELEKILRFSKGFEIPGGFLEEVRFDNFGEFGFEELFQFNLTITDDRTGNYWIQEINGKGEWGKIYYVCHDSPVIIKQAENLSEFLIQIHEFLAKGEESFLSKMINEIVGKIYLGKGRLLEQEEALNSNEKLLSKFASKYDKDWFIADLRSAKNGEGFRLEASYKETIRLDDELIWALKKYKNCWIKLKEKFKKEKATANNQDDASLPSVRPSHTVGVLGH